MQPPGLELGGNPRDALQEGLEAELRQCRDQLLVIDGAAPVLIVREEDLGGAQRRVGTERRRRRRRHRGARTL